MIASALVATLLIGAQPVQTSLVFLPHSTMAKKQKAMQMGVSDALFTRCVNHIWLRLLDDKFQPTQNETVTSISKKLKSLVDETEAKLAGVSSEKLSKVGKQWLLAEACAGWSSVYVKYSTDITDALGRGEKVSTPDLAKPEVTLSTTPPKAVCSGYSVLTRQLARELGLQCNVLQGHLRPLDYKTGSKLGGHCWVEFIFEGDVHVPADATLAAGDVRNSIKKFNGKHCGYNVLPRRDVEWEVFLSRNFNWSPIPKNITTHGDERGSTPQLDLSEEDWLKVPFGHIRPLQIAIATGKA